MNKKLLTTIIFLDILLLAPLAASADTADSMVKSIQAALMIIATSVVVIGWVIAGILWLTSAGSPDKTGTAKKATVAAVIGTIVIVLASQAYAVINDLLTGYEMK